jgi:hypothetical protein
MKTIIVLLVTLTYQSGLVEKYRMPMPQAETMGVCQVVQDLLNSQNPVKNNKVTVRALCVPTGE